MKKIFYAACMVAIVAIGAIPSSATSKSIVDIAAGDPQFSTLVSLLKEAKLVETLNGEGPFTVFAPTNSAFEKIPSESLLALKKDPAKLKKVLTYHVVGGAVSSESASKLTEAETVAGEKLSIKKSYGALKVDNAKVVKADITASNGVVHVVDSVLMP